MEEADKDWMMIIRAKDVLPNINRTQPAEITPELRWNGSICCSMSLFAVNTFHSIAAGGRWKRIAHFLSLVTLSFNLDIQTRLNEGPNTSSL